MELLRCTQNVVTQSLLSAMLLAFFILVIMERLLMVSFVISLSHTNMT